MWMHRSLVAALDSFLARAILQENRYPLFLIALYGHFTTGGIDDRMLSTLPPVFRPKIVPRS